MFHGRQPILGFFMMFALVGAPVARPLSVTDLVALGATVQPELLLRLAEHRGLDRALGEDDREALLGAGLSPALVDRLVLLAQPAAEVDGVAYAVVDGVIRVRAQGSGPGLPAGQAAEDRLAGDEPYVAPEGHQASEEAVAADPHALSAESAPDAGWSNPYPAGAFGATVGVVFIPARFGDRPSAFGRTIVATWPGTHSSCGSPCETFTAGGLLGGQPRHHQRSDGFIPLRTSRGTLWVPN